MEKFIPARRWKQKVQLAVDRLAAIRCLPNMYANCRGLFIVSQVELTPGKGPVVAVKIERADGTKCERCWKFTEDVGANPDLPTICGACADAGAGKRQSRKFSAIKR